MDANVSTFIEKQKNGRHGAGLGMATLSQLRRLISKLVP